MWRSAVRKLGLGLVLSSLTACAAFAPVAEESAPASAGQVTLDRLSYRLSSGDKIRIEVYGEADLSLEAPIEAAGTINYPLLGRIVVQGYTLNEIEQLIARRLSQGYLVKPSVRANIVQFRPFYVTGQVRRVGAYPFSEGLTVEKALALAGGLTEIGSTRKMYIVREGLKSVREKASLLTQLLPGDTIIVDESLF